MLLAFKLALYGFVVYHAEFSSSMQTSAWYLMVFAMVTRVATRRLLKVKVLTFLHGSATIGLKQLCHRGLVRFGAVGAVGASCFDIFESV